MTLHFLVVEGNTAAGREEYRIGFGKAPSESYADALREIAPGAACDICFPADSGADLPASLADYDGVFLTGSALNVYDGGPAVERQIELARSVFASGVAFFGSCWGLQVACAAAGGRVLRNPRGREIGLARRIWLTDGGRRHPLLEGRPPAYEALCSHIDVVELPPGGVSLASNEMANVQAAEIVFAGGRFWGVQYHPEFSFGEIAAIVERRADTLASEGFATDGKAVRAYARDLRALDESPATLAWSLGAGESVLTAQARRLELSNFITERVLPKKSERGRA